MDKSRSSLYQSFDHESTLGDSLYFSAVDSDDSYDGDKTIANDKQSLNDRNVKNSSNKDVSFIPKSANRYSALTQKTINREFQKKLMSVRTPRKETSWTVTETASKQSLQKEKSPVKSPKPVSPKSPKVTKIPQAPMIKKEEDKENVIETTTLANVEDKRKEHKNEEVILLDNVLPECNSSDDSVINKTVLGAHITEVITVTEKQEESVPSTEVTNTVVKKKINTESTSAQESAKQSTASKNTGKYVKPTVTNGTKPEPLIKSRPVTSAPKPINVRKSMAVVKNIISKARASAANNTSESGVRHAGIGNVALNAVATVHTNRSSLVATLAASYTKRQTSSGFATGRRSFTRVSIVPSASVKSQRRQSKNFYQAANPKRKTMYNPSRQSMIPRVGPVSNAPKTTIPAATVDKVPGKSIPPAVEKPILKQPSKRMTIANAPSSMLSDAFKAIKISNPKSSTSETEKVQVIKARVSQVFSKQIKNNFVPKKVSETVKRTTICYATNTTIASQRPSVAKVTSSTITATVTAGIAPKKETEACSRTVTFASPPSATSKPVNGVSNEAKRWKCDDCKRLFSTEFARKVHIENVHNLSSTFKKMAPPMVNPLKCKYCDRNFSLDFAFDKHIRENCTKISPAERKRFIVESEKSKTKSQSGNSNAFTSKQTKLKSNTILNRLNVVNLTGDEYDGTDLNDTNSIKLTHNNLGHTGIYRTPSKSIPCKSCNITFFNCVEYAEHCVQVHS